MGAIYSLKGHNGQLEVFEDRVIISRKGFIGFLSQGFAGDKVIPMQAIQSVQYKEGGSLVNGFIQFAVMGGRERQGGVLAATKDENTIMLRAGEQSQIGKQIKDYIENRILELSKPQTTQTIQQTSAADEILKFKNLLDSGIITEEEFNRKKEELLG